MIIVGSAFLLFLVGFIALLTDVLLHDVTLKGEYWDYELEGFVSYTPSFEASIISLSSFVIGYLILSFSAPKLRVKTAKAKGWEGFIGYDVMRFLKRKLKWKK